jgi:aspartate-semialdehyde dehydrogenase
MKDLELLLNIARVLQEMKMTKETRKIWNAPDVMAMATCIRVPVMRAHAESINLELAESIGEEEARELLAAAPGVSLIDDRYGAPPRSREHESSSTVTAFLLETMATWL